MKILTHNGVWHADEVTAIAIILMAFPDSEIERTRDAGRLAEALADPNTIVVDVGHEHSAERNNFDHHQHKRGFEMKRANGIPYSSVGLIWETYGPAALRKEFPAAGTNDIMSIWDSVEEGFIQEIDRIDNGDWPPGAHSGYSAIISSLNPVPLMEDEGDAPLLWHVALALASTRLERVCIKAMSKIKALDVWAKATLVADGRGLELPTFIPWYDLAVDLPEEVLYVTWPDARANQWVAQQIPAEAGSPSGRKSFPEHWRGLEGESLAQACDVADAIFCHGGGFLAIAQSRESILRMIQMAADA